MESAVSLIDSMSPIMFAVSVFAALAGCYALFFTRESGRGAQLIVMAAVLAGFPLVSRVIKMLVGVPRAAEDPSPAPPATQAPVDSPQLVPPLQPLPADPSPEMPPIAVGEPMELPAWFWPALGVISLVVVLAIFSVMLGYRVLAKRRNHRELGQEAERLWDLHVRGLNELKAEYTAFETDPWTAFSRPLLTDVTEPLTAKFHEAFARAQELHTEQRPTSRELVDLFGDAVRAATAAWSAADQHAREVAVPTTTDAERRRLRRAEDALRLALDERTSPAERMVALARVEHLIAGLTVMPTKARTTIVAELETKTRLAISGGSLSEQAATLT